MPKTEFCVVYVTTPDNETSERIAAALVEEKLAACVNCVPGVRSLYTWQGKIQNEMEELLVIKTRVKSLDALTGRVKALHPYEVPEVIALPVIGGSREYLDWIEETTSL